MKITFQRLLAIALIALGLAACDDKSKSTPAEMTKVSLRLAWLYDMAEVGIFVAKKEGYFAREGLDVTIEPGGFGLDPIKLVAAGTNDFGIGGAGNLLLARAQGVPAVAIAAEFQNTPVGFITRKDSGITTFPKFRGRRIGIQTGSDTDVLYRALLARNGMTSTDVTEVPIQFDMTPFTSGQIDVLPGYITNQPIVLEDRGIPVNVVSAKSQGLSYYGNVFFTTEATLRNKPELVARFARAVRAGWERALADKATAVSAVSDLTKDFKTTDLDRIYDAVMPHIRPDEADVRLLGMTEARWKATHQVLTDAGLLKNSTELNAAYTSKFIGE